MKVLFLNETDIKGGAAQAAYRLLQGIERQGINSKMIVRKKYSNDSKIKTRYTSDFGNILDQINSGINDLFLNFQDSQNPVAHSANLFPTGLHKAINKSKVDIVHLHWVGGKMITIKEISKITKPIVWTLHDMWAFCGTEHYDDLNSPGRYKEGYYTGNRPANNKGLDIDQYSWKKKMKYWSDVTFDFVAPSNWMARCVRESMLFKNQVIKVIPNGLDLNVYKPIAKNWAKKILNIPEGNKETRYILFGALSPLNDERKGFQQLLKSLSKLKTKINNLDLRLLVFGSKYSKVPDFGLPTTYLGYLHDDTSLAMAYSAADVMVVPSLQDNLPNTAVEASACGTPVVAFDVGGLSDIIDHKVNGFLVEPFSPEHFAEGIMWILENSNRNQALSVKAREKAIKKFDIETVSKKYIELYSETVK